MKTEKQLIDLLKTIPPNSEIPCTYLFTACDSYEKGFIVSDTFNIYLKHNSISHQGYGRSYKEFKHSWFLCEYSSVNYDLSGVLDIALYACPLGEL